MSEPALHLMPPAPLMLTLLPAALILLGSALANAIRHTPLQDRCRAILPTAPATAARVVIAAQGLSALLLLLAPSALVSALCLTGLLLSRMSAGQTPAGTIPGPHLGITGHLPLSAARLLDAILALSLLTAALFAALLAILPPAGPDPVLPVFPPALTLIELGGVLLGVAALLLISTRAPLFNLLPWLGRLEPGHRWPSTQIALPTGTEPVIVLLMGHTPATSQSWLRLLRARAAMGYFYPLHIVTDSANNLIGLTGGQTESHTLLSPGRIAALSATLPCVLLVHQGVVVARWADSLPADWVSLSPPRPASIPAAPLRPVRRRAPLIPLRASGILHRAPTHKAAENHRYFSHGPV